MESIFNSIEDKRELDELLNHLRAGYRSALDARDTTKKIITRRIKQPEFVRTINRRLFPQFQQMVIEFREMIVEAKEQRSDVQRAAGKDDSSRTNQPPADGN